MAKRIAAESGRPVLGIFKQLLLHGASIEVPCQSHREIVGMNVEMHGRPVALVVAGLLRVSRASGAGPFSSKQTFVLPARNTATPGKGAEDSVKPKALV